MKQILLFQVLAFTIYLINHIGHFFKEQIMSQELKIGFGAFLLLIITIFFWDYQFNFKKQLKFKVSAFLFLSYGIGLWLIDGFYYLAVLNLILFIAFYLFNKKFDTISTTAKEN